MTWKFWKGRPLTIIPFKSHWGHSTVLKETAHYTMTKNVYNEVSILFHKLIWTNHTHKTIPCFCCHVPSCCYQSDLLCSTWSNVILSSRVEQQRHRPGEIFLIQQNKTYKWKRTHRHAFACSDELSQFAQFPLCPYPLFSHLSPITGVPTVWLRSGRFFPA